MKISRRDSKGRIAKGSNLIHGMSDEPIYDCWVAMKARCNNPQNPGYKYYGARGISVDPNWNSSFMSFWNDIKSIYKPGLTIDRIDNDGNYEPSNVRFITIQEQQKNTRSNGEYVGVNFESSRNKWRATITRNGKNKFLGRFENKVDAIKARAKAEHGLNL